MFRIALVPELYAAVGPVGLMVYVLVFLFVLVIQTFIRKLPEILRAATETVVALRETSPAKPPARGPRSRSEDTDSG